MKSLSQIAVFLLCVMLACKPGGSTTETTTQDSLPQDSIVEYGEEGTPEFADEDEGEPEEAPGPDQLHDSDYGIYHFTFKVNERLPHFSLVLHTPDKKYYVYGNEFEKGTPIQEIPFSEDVEYEEVYENPDATFGFGDYNFDGYRDITIMSISGAKNILSDIYLFNPSSTVFIKNDFLSGLNTLTIDSVKKTLSYYNNGGMAGASYNSGVVRWKNSAPTTIREEEQTYVDGSESVFVRTIKVLDAGGKMVAACKVRIEPLDGGKERQCLLEGDWAEFDKYPSLFFAEDMAHVVRTDGRSGSCE